MCKGSLCPSRQATFFPLSEACLVNPSGGSISISSMVPLMMKQEASVPDQTTLLLPFVSLSLYPLCHLYTPVLLSNTSHCVYLRKQSGPRVIEAIGIKKCSQIRCFHFNSLFHMPDHSHGLRCPASLTSALTACTLLIRILLTYEGYNCLSLLFNTFIICLSASVSDVVAYLLFTLT